MQKGKKGEYLRLKPELVTKFLECSHPKYFRIYFA
jgi:hypothetical protein